MRVVSCRGRCVSSEIAYHTFYRRSNVAMTAEQRKIKRLEKSVADYKEEVSELKEVIRKQNRELVCERQWRQDFQRLMKTVVQEDTLDDCVRDYW